MRAVVQRVERADVQVEGSVIASIGTGLLVLVGVTHTDTQAQAEALARKLHGLRILRDERSVADASDEAPAAILVVSQFTLYGDVRKGRRPTWAGAAPAATARPLVDSVVAALRQLGAHVETGVFGADMRVGLVNDGPVTLILDL